jgi:uncharacterized membrane protein YphA (DoxX/SURF4 family)
MNQQKLSRFAPVVLRLGLVFVYSWFGASQITHSANWVSLVPAWATTLSGMSATTIVLLNGWFELFAATALGIGFFVPYVAGLLFLHLLVIASHLGINPTGIRDIGLTISTLALSLFGNDSYCITSNKKE